MRKIPNNKFRLRHAMIGEKPVLVLQIERQIYSGYNVAISVNDIEWADATIEDFSEVSQIALRGCLPSEINR